MKCPLNHTLPSAPIAALCAYIFTSYVFHALDAGVYLARRFGPPSTTHQSPLAATSTARGLAFITGIPSCAK